MVEHEQEPRTLTLMRDYTGKVPIIEVRKTIGRDVIQAIQEGLSPTLGQAPRVFSNEILALLFFNQGVRDDAHLASVGLQVCEQLGSLGISASVANPDSVTPTLIGLSEGGVTK